MDNIKELEDHCRTLVDYKQWYSAMGKDPSNGNASFRRMVLPITNKLRLFNRMLAHIGWEVVVQKKEQ